MICSRIFTASRNEIALTCSLIFLLFYANRMKIIVIFTLIALISCHKTPSHKGSVEITLKVNSDFILASQFSIAQLVFYNQDNQPFRLLDNNPITLTLDSDDTSRLILKASIPEGQYSQVEIKLALSQSAFWALNENELITLSLINSLNQAIPSEAVEFTVKAQIEATPLTIAKEQTATLQLLFDADKSIQPLGQRTEASPITSLFKPYWHAKAILSDRHFYAEVNEHDGLNLIIQPQYSSGTEILVVNERDLFFINEMSVDQTVFFSTITNQSGLLRIDESIESKKITWLTADNNRLLKGTLFKSTLDELPSYAIVGIFTQGETPNFTKVAIKPNLTLTLENQGFNIAIDSFAPLLKGQQLTGVIDSTGASLTLQNTKMMGLITSYNPPTIKALTYHHLPLAHTPSLIVKTVTPEIQTMPLNSLIEFEGVAVNNAFYHSKIIQIGTNQATLSIRLPPTLSPGLISSMKSGLWTLRKADFDTEHWQIKLSNGLLTYDKKIDQIDVTEAKFSLFSDRYTDGSLITHYDSVERFENALKVYLMDAAHINEIHATGFIVNNLFYANKIDMVIYGPSSFDVQNTDLVIDNINSTDNSQGVVEEEDSKPFSTQLSNGETLAIILATTPFVSATGLLLYYLKQNPTPATQTSGNKFKAFLLKANPNKLEEIKGKIILADGSNMDLSDLLNNQMITDDIIKKFWENFAKEHSINLENYVSSFNSTNNELANFQGTVDFNKPYFDNFKSSDKSNFWIVPIVENMHFNTLLFVKTKGGIQPILIEPFQRAFGTLADTAKKVIKAYGIEKELIQLNSGIQNDGCSCGPISAVFAKDFILSLNKKFEKNEQIDLNSTSVNTIKNEIKVNNKYYIEPNAYNIRADMLDTISNHSLQLYDYHIRKPGQAFEKVPLIKKAIKK